MLQPSKQHILLPPHGSSGPQTGTKSGPGHSEVSAGTGHSKISVGPFFNGFPATLAAPALPGGPRGPRGPFRPRRPVRPGSPGGPCKVQPHFITSKFPLA